MKEMKARANNPNGTHSKDHIAENLKLVYDTIQDEPLPQRFTKLLEKLKNEEKS